MPLMLILVLSAVGVADGSSLTIVDKYPGDAIKVLWWTLGVVMSFVTLVLGGIGVWALKEILQHSKDITAIKAGCLLHKEMKEE